LAGKKSLMKAINKLYPLNMRRPNNFLIQIFFDAKVEEIVNIFQDGSKIDFEETYEILMKIAPFFGVRWKEIKA